MSNDWNDWGESDEAWEGIDGEAKPAGIPAYSPKPAGTPVKEAPTMLEQHRLSPGRYVTITPQMRTRMAAGAGTAQEGNKLTHRVAPGRYLVTDLEGLGTNGFPTSADKTAAYGGGMTASSPAGGGGLPEFDAWRNPGAWGQLFSGIGEGASAIATGVAQVESGRAQADIARQQAAGEMSMLQQLMSQMFQQQPAPGEQQPAQQQPGAMMYPGAGAPGGGATTAIIVVGGLAILLLGGGLIWAVSRRGD